MKIKPMMALLMSIIFAVAGMNSATAATNEYNANHLTESQVATLRSDLIAGGATVEQTENLIRKITDGELWDSQTSGKTPVQTSSFVKNGEHVRKEVYEDGSFVIISTSIPERLNSGNNSPFASVSGCKLAFKSNYSAKYTGCKVKANWFTTWLEFEFSYETVNGKPGKITWYGNEVYGGLFGGFNNVKFTKTNNYTVRLSGQWHAIKELQQTTLWVQVSVPSVSPVVSQGAQVLELEKWKFLDTQHLSLEYFF